MTPGTPGWAVLSTPDVAAAGRYYGAVLGWEVPEADGGQVVARVDGAAAAGIGPSRPGSPSGWTLCFATDDADAGAAAVPGHGGTLLGPVVDDGLARTVLARDPSGAAFGLRQAGSLAGCELLGRPGGLVWHDLRSTDPAAAQAFYRALLGHELAPVAVAGADYAVFRPPGAPAPCGGIGGLMGFPGPSRWLVHVAVPDVDAAVRAALDAGGSVTVPAKDSSFGRLAGLADPEGAELWVFQVPGRAAPEREHAAGSGRLGA